MTINRPIEKRKQKTPKEMIKKNIPKEIKKQKTPKEIKTNKKINKKKKQKTPKEIKLSPKTIEQRGGIMNPEHFKNLKKNSGSVYSKKSPKNQELYEPIQVATPVNKIPIAYVNTSTHNTKNLPQAIKVTSQEYSQNKSQLHANSLNPKIEEKSQSNAKSLNAIIEEDTKPNTKQENSQLITTSLNEIIEKSQSNAITGDPQPNALEGDTQPNSIPQNNSQQKSSIMTESDFMKKYEITETQIKQVKLLLSNAFAA